MKKLVFLLFLNNLFFTLTFAQLHQETAGLLLKKADGNSGVYSKIDSLITLTQLGSWPWGPCQTVAIKLHFAYIGNSALFQILDLSNPLSPTIVGQTQHGSSIFDIKLRDTLAFVCTSGGLHIIDVSDSNNPTRLSGVSIGGTPIRVAVSDSFAYVSTMTGGVVVDDVSDIYHPRVRGMTFVGDRDVYCIAERNGYVYAGNNEVPRQMAIIDARNPDTLQESFLSLSGFPLSAFVKDTLLFLGSFGGQSLKVFSIADPSSPQKLGGVIL